MTDDYAELKRLAEAATKGPWSCKQTIIQGKAYGGKWVERSDGEGVKLSGSGGAVSYTREVFTTQDHDDNDVNAAFIAAANPAAILSLIQRVEEAENDVAFLNALATTPIDIMRERLHADGRLAGIEEAAKVADGFTCGGCGMDGKCAAAIRALGALPNDP